MSVNKSDTPPHIWFRRAEYRDEDLKERLLRWDLLQPGAFDTMIEERSRLIKERAERMFGMKVEDFNALF